MMVRTLSVPSVACVVWLAGSGCGGAMAPMTDRTDAIAAVQSAREVGAEGTPHASYHLALADAELGDADALVERGQMAPARRSFERARADAELAMALRREAVARARAAESHRHIDEQRDNHLGTDGK